MKIIPGKSRAKGGFSSNLQGVQKFLAAAAASHDKKLFASC